MEQTETLLQSLQFSSSKMCLLHLTEIHPGSRALVSLVRNFHRQGSFKDRNLLSQLWRLEGWDQGASVVGFRWEPSCRFAHTAGCREDTGGSSSLLSLLIRVQIPSTGLLPNDFTQPYLSPKGPHPLTPSHWSQEESHGGPGHRRLSVSHFLVCREQPPWPPPEFQRADSNSC